MNLHLKAWKAEILYFSLGFIESFQKVLCEVKKTFYKQNHVVCRLCFKKIKITKSCKMGNRSWNKLFVILLTFLSNEFHDGVCTADYYRPLPLYTGSISELHNKAIWPQRNEEKTTGRPMSMNKDLNFDIDQIMNDMGSIAPSTHGNDTFFRAQQKDSWLSTVKIIPDEHHVSAFLNKGIVKR